MKTKRLLTIAVTLLLLLILTSCRSKQLDFPTLDRLTVIEAIPKTELPSDSSAKGDEARVLFDNSASMLG